MQSFVVVFFFFYWGIQDHFKCDWYQHSIQRTRTDKKCSPLMGIISLPQATGCCGNFVSENL